MDNRSDKGMRSQRVIAVLALAILLPSSRFVCADETEADGYALLMKACQLQKALPEVNTSYGPMRDDLERFLRFDMSPTTGIVQRVEQEAGVLSLIEQASEAQKWSPPDRQTISASTELPEIHFWSGISWWSAAQAAMELQQGHAEDALGTIGSMNRLGIRLAKEPMTVLALMHIHERRWCYPALISAVDALPVESLRSNLDSLVSQYDQISALRECFDGEYCFVSNTIHRDFFAPLYTNAELRSAQANLIAGLKRQGAESSVVQQVEGGEILSVSNWETKVTADCAAFWSKYSARALTELHTDANLIDRDMAAEINAMGTCATSSVALNIWKMAASSNEISVIDMSNLHTSVGTAIERELVGLLAIDFGMFARRYNEYLASERLVLVHIASRLYKAEHGRWPDRLQALVDVGLLQAGVIVDPYSGQTFLQKVNSDFVDWYSVGKDLDDDGGDISNDPNGELPGDVGLLPLQEMAPQKP